MIELTPEWILMNLIGNWVTDGNGLAIITIVKSNPSKAFIELALKSLKIGWKANMFSTNQGLEIDYLFEIEDIKDLCPVFYEKLWEDNNDIKVDHQSLVYDDNEYKRSIISGGQRN